MKSTPESLARGLGWFSLALGSAELLMARSLCRTLGLQGREDVLRTWGLREIATGLALLRAKNPAPAVWARVAGDVLDLATLAPALQGGNPQRGQAAFAVAAVAGVTAVDVACARMLGGVQEAAAQTVDYSDRRGFPQPAEAMRGAAAQDFETPEDMATPSALRPYTYH